MLVVVAVTLFLLIISFLSIVYTNNILSYIPYRHHHYYQVETIQPGNISVWYVLCFQEQSILGEHEFV